MVFKININRWRTKRVGFNFDMYAWQYLCEMNGIEIHQMGDLDPQKLSKDLIYAAYVSHCKDNGKHYVEQDKLSRWVDKMTVVQGNALSKLILNSRVFGKSVGSMGEKKKSPGGKS